MLLKTRFNRIFLGLLSFSFLARPFEAIADDVFKWTDSAGVTHYSTSAKNREGENLKTSAPGQLKSGQRVDLPQLSRENIDKRISAIKGAIPETCDTHGGINCGIGADADGSVICTDGYKDAILLYNSNCLEAHLRAEDIILVLDDGSRLSLGEARQLVGADRPLPAVPERIIVSARNITGIEARGVSVNFSFPSQIPPGIPPQAIRGRYFADFLASGPDKIAGYGMNDYELLLSGDSLTGLMNALNFRRRSSVKYRIDCANCQMTKETAGEG